MGEELYEKLEKCSFFGYTPNDIKDTQVLTGKMIALEQFSRFPHAVIALLKKYQDLIKICNVAPECITERDIALVCDRRERDPCHRGWEFVAEGDERQAMLKNAIKQERNDARLTLGLLNDDPELLRGASLGGNLDAQYAYGKTLHGENRLEVLSGAADQGHPESQFALGEMYESGDGAMRNEAKAVQRYKEAAQQEHAAAEYALGSLHISGECGVKQSNTQAIKFITKSAEQGYTEAQYTLAILHKNGECGLPQSDREAVHWYERAAEQGHAKSQNDLAVMYLEGRVKDTEHYSLDLLFCTTEEIQQNNYTQAEYWFKEAAKQGHEIAKENLDHMRATGKTLMRSDAEAAHPMA